MGGLERLSEAGGCRAICHIFKSGFLTPVWLYFRVYQIEMLTTGRDYFANLRIHPLAINCLIVFVEKYYIMAVIHG
jgi:hypothetical protein